MKNVTKLLKVAAITGIGIMLTSCLVSCGTSWTVSVTPDGITAKPDGPIHIPISKEK